MALAHCVASVSEEEEMRGHAKVYERGSFSAEIYVNYHEWALPLAVGGAIDEFGTRHAWVQLGPVTLEARWV